MTIPFNWKSTSLVVLSLALSLIAAFVVPQEARSIQNSPRIRLELTRREPFVGGMSFGAVGPYEKLAGKIYGEVDPADARNAVITDLGLAPKNARGMIEYSTDVYILRPVDPSKGNHRLLFDINNRGDNRAVRFFNDAPAAVVNDPATATDAGNGFLMRQGYTMVWSGWDPTVPPGNGRFTMTAPVAKNPDGSTIVGPALEEYAIENTTTMTRPLTYPAATLDKSQASLTVRVRYEDPPVPVPSANWDYTDASGTAIKLLPNGTAFQRGTLYDLVYPAKDPLVVGLGFAAIRDVAAFLHRSTMDDQGNLNPLAGDVQFTYSFCVSQPCRTLHDLLSLGFNEDRSGQRVFDGMLNWVGGGSGIFMNYRFAQPEVTHRQHIARWYPELQFPFANQVIFDPVTGKTDGRLRRCLATGTCPKIFETNSEGEYWNKAGSLLHTDTLGNDLPDPPNVRHYLFSSLPHTASSGPGICAQPRNPIAPNPGLRALLLALDEWVTSGKEPPASQVPRRSDGTLVPSLPQDGVGFPNIPGVTYNGRLHTGDLWDFGPLFDQGILTVLPPRLIGTPYPAMVPKTDADGNNVAGIRFPDVAVPVATYTGWALRGFPPDGGDGCDAAGQVIPFAPTKAARQATGDSRLSIEERYPTNQAYVDAVRQTANLLKSQRFLIDEDVQKYIAAAAASNIGK